MMVTNEQAIAVKNMINGRTYIYANGNDIPADWFAIDLLEARELIKEMRKFIDNVDYARLSDELRSESILEKTKDYA